MDDDGPVDARRRRHPIGRAVAVLGWLVVAGLVGFLVLRVVAYDTRRVTIAITAYTPYWFLPIYPVLLFAALTRRRALILASAALVMVHVLFVAPRLGAEDVPDEASSSPQLRVLTANVMSQNTSREALGRELLGYDADVIALIEFTPAWSDTLSALGITERFPHWVEFHQKGTQGIAVFSRLPIRDGRIARAGGRPIARLDIEVGGEWVHVVAAHPPPPHSDRRALHYELTRLSDLADDIDGPLVVMGDMNSTLYNRALRHVLAGDLRCAHDARGRSLFATSWPNGTRRAPPALIDHVLVSSDIAVLDVREGDGEGSDHRPVIADLAILSMAAD